MSTPTIAVIPGDGIGPEVTHEALKVLRATLGEIDTREFFLGARRYHETGEVLPDAELEALQEADAILLGAIGDPSVPPGVLERGLLLKLRFSFDHYVNLRPSQLYPGVTSPLRDVKPGEVAFTVVREGTEGLYCGAGGTLARGTVREVATEESLNTRSGVERVIRDAFDRASRTERKKLTLVHKNNVLVHAGDLWARSFTEIAAEYLEVETEYLHVDAAAMFLVTQPQRFDVIVTDNLFGDILTDVAAAITGGIGLAASGNINPTREHPSMFEPVHGSAPDIAGQGIADPIAAITSAALLADHLGESTAASVIRDAVHAELSQRVADTPLVTTEVGDRVCADVETLLAVRNMYDG